MLCHFVDLGPELDFVDQQVCADVVVVRKLVNGARLAHGERGRRFGGHGGNDRKTQTPKTYGIQGEYARDEDKAVVSCQDIHSQKTTASEVGDGGVTDFVGGGGGNLFVRKEGAGKAERVLLVGQRETLVTQSSQSLPPRPKK